MNYTVCGNALQLPYPDGVAQVCVTSPPYMGLRDYGTARWEGGEAGCDHKQGRPGAGRADGIVDERSQRNRDGVGSMGGDCAKCGAKRIDAQIGLEQTPAAYVAQIVAAMREVWRVLRDDGTLWLNLGDSYNSNASNQNGTSGGMNRPSRDGAFTSQGRRNKQVDSLKPKDLIGIPWRVAFALQDDGWYLRSDIIWAKPNPMPESVTDRPTKAHEYLFLLAKQPRYYYDAEAIAEPSGGANGSSFISEYDRETKPGLGMGERKEAATRNARSVWQIATQPYSASTSISIAACDYVSADGTPYKASASCPIHGPMLASGMFDRASNGGQPIRLTRRNSGTGSRHVRVRASLPTPTTSRNETAGASESGDVRTLGNTGGRKTSTPRPGHTLPAQTRLHSSRTEEPGELLSDSPDSEARPYSEPATDHSNGTNKTARALPTEQRDTGGGQTLSRTSNTSLFDESAGQDQNSVSSSNGEGDTNDYRTAETESHTGGMYSHDELSCTCVKVSIDHFATMPPELARRCILAGTSARGQCPKCGAPWVRVVEKGLTAHDGETESAYEKGTTANRLAKLRQAARERGEEYSNGKVTTGWAASCACDATGAVFEPDDFEIVASPTGERAGDDPSLETGRAGMNRPRGENEGKRPMTRYEQRRYASQLRESPHREAMEAEAGKSFAHYIRVDRAGARPVPPDLLAAWIERGWLDAVAPPILTPYGPIPQIVLDPFAGSGTTAMCALQNGRRAIGTELNPKYLRLQDDRTQVTIGLGF